MAVSSYGIEQIALRFLDDAKLQKVTTLSQASLAQNFPFSKHNR